MTKWIGFKNFSVASRSFNIWNVFMLNRKKLFNLEEDILKDIWYIFRYVLYVTAIDQGEPVEERRTSMAIVEIRVEGDFNARPLTDSEAEAPGVPQQAPVVVQNGRKKEISTDTSEFLKEQQRKVRNLKIKLGICLWIKLCRFRMQERLAQNDQHPVQGVTQRSRAPLITLGPWFVHQLEEFQIDKNARWLFISIFKFFKANPLVLFTDPGLRWVVQKWKVYPVMEVPFDGPWCIVINVVVRLEFI